MKNCYIHWYIDPFRSDLEASSDFKPAFETTIIYEEYCHKIAVFNDQSGIPKYIRLEIPNLKEEKIEEDHLPRIQAAKEHMLSILRLTYLPTANLLPLSINIFIDKDESYKVNPLIEEVIGIASFDSDAAHGYFDNSFKFREDVRLLTDGLDAQIPLQYRYLSLYKIFELNFKNEKEWLDDKITKILSPFSGEFKKLEVNDPITHLQNLRHKCAHIKIDGEIGVTHLNQKDAALVEAVLPLFAKICIEIINEKGNGDFKLEI